MELINRVNKDVIAYRQQSNQPMLVLRDYRMLYLNYPLVLEMNVTEDRYAHFFIEDERLFMFINSEPAGFKLWRAYEDRAHSGYYIFSTALVSKVLAETAAKLRAGYRVKKTKANFEGAVIYEVFIDQKVKML